MIKTSDCPKFKKCHAPVCPLDDQTSTHLQNEPICFYLREVVKPGGIARISQYIPEEMAKRVVQAIPDILSRYVDIKNRLSRTSCTPSKIDSIHPSCREDMAA